MHDIFNFCSKIVNTPLVAEKFYAKGRKKEMKEQKEKITEKEWYKRRIAEMVEGIENTGKLKYIYAILSTYLKNRGN